MTILLLLILYFVLQYRSEMRWLGQEIELRKLRGEKGKTEIKGELFTYEVDLQ